MKRPPQLDAPAPQLVYSDPNAQPEPLDFLIDPFLPRKRLVSLVAPGGTGKGTVWRSWVAALSRGRDPLTNAPAAVGKPASVLIVSFEESWASDILPGLLAEGADLTRVRHLAGIRHGGDREDFALRNMPVLLDDLRAWPEPPALVIFDPAMELLGSAGISGYNDGEVRHALIVPARRIIEVTGATVLLVMHFNKDRGQDLPARTAGTAGLVNAIRLQISMIRHPRDEAIGVVGITKQNIGRECTMTYRVAPVGAAALAEIRGRYPEMAGPEHDARWAKLAERLVTVAWGPRSPEGIAELYQLGALDRDAPTDEDVILEWVLGRANGVQPSDLRTFLRAGRRQFADAAAAEAYLNGLVSQGLGKWQRCLLRGGRVFMPSLLAR